MKRITILGIAILTSLSSYSQIAEDKKLHFYAGATTSALVNLHIQSKTKDKKKAFIYGVASSFAIGLAKEVKDEIDYGGFDTKDLIATVLGGFTISIALDTRRKKTKLINKQ